jgi:predicted DNA-binding ribbon-helix-helix protein
MVNINQEINLADQRAESRVLQHDKRRYCLRLEPVFWRVLERFAQRRQLRPGRIVAELEGGAKIGPGGAANLTSRLRAYLMAEAEAALAAGALGASAANLELLVGAAPAPALVLGPERGIVAANAALGAWLGPGHAPLIGAELTEVFQVRTRRPLNEVWRRLVQGQTAEAEARFLHLAPGRVLAAEGRLVALRRRRGEAFACVVWLTLPRAAAAAAPRPQP